MNTSQRETRSTHSCTRAAPTWAARTQRTMTPSRMSAGLRPRNPASTRDGDRPGVSGRSLWVTPCPRNVSKPFIHLSTPPITWFEDGPCDADPFSPLAKDAEKGHSKDGGKRCQKVLEGKRPLLAQSRSGRGHKVLSWRTPASVASRRTAGEEDRPGWAGGNVDRERIRSSGSIVRLVGMKCFSEWT